MKRKFIAFSMTMALLLSAFSAASVGAHTAPIEFTPTTPTTPPSRAEWFGKEPDQSGEAIIQRNSAQEGELIYNDAKKDQRLITASPVQVTDKITREVDLDWLGVTADANNVYFLAKSENYFGIKSDPSIELIITVDRTQDGAGTRQIPLGITTPYSVTNVPADAAWEYAIDTSFRPGVTTGPQPPYVNGATKIWTNGTTNSPCATCLSQLASATVQSGSFSEIAIPWSAIGGQPIDAAYLRFTASIMYSPTDANDPDTRATPPTTDGVNTPIADFLGEEKTAAETATTLASGTLKDSSVFDVHFNTNGGAAATYEPYAPLLVTEFQANPLGDDSPGPTNPTSQDSEWIEIYNPNSFPITNLSDYKIGNAAKRGSSQGMFKFNGGSIPALGTIVVARFKSRFLISHPTFDQSKLIGLDEMTQYAPWSPGGGTLSLDNEPKAPATTFEEQILILDGKDDIVDLVNYGNPTTPYPGNTPINVPAILDNGGSYERCPAGTDTNNNNADFIHRATVADETPGVACAGRPGIDMQISKTGPVNVRPGDPVQFILSYANLGGTNETAGTVTITDTLPTGLTFVSAVPAPSSTSGNTLTWVLTAPLQGGAQSTITLLTTAGAGLAANTPLVNTAGISSANEPPAPTGDRTNNVAAWTVTTLGPVDLGVSSNFAGPVPPGGQFTFTISYQNSGQDDATGVTVSDTLPAGVTLIDQEADGASFNGGSSGTISWNVGALPANASGKIVVTAQIGSGVAVGTSLPNTVTISGDNPGAEPAQANNTETKSLTVDFRKLYLALIRK